MCLGSSYSVPNFSNSLPGSVLAFLLADSSAEREGEGEGGEGETKGHIAHFLFLSP